MTSQRGASASVIQLERVGLALTAHALRAVPGILKLNDSLAAKEPLSLANVVLLAGLVMGCSTEATPRQPADAPPGQSATTAQNHQPDTTVDYLITAAAMGPLRLGMTLGEARTTVPSAFFARTSDGDGVALVEITLAEEVSVVAWAGEDDRDAAIEWSNSIQRLETFDPGFRTPGGVRELASATACLAAIGLPAPSPSRTSKSMRRIPHSTCSRTSPISSTIRSTAISSISASNAWRRHERARTASVRTGANTDGEAIRPLARAAGELRHVLRERLRRQLQPLHHRYRGALGWTADCSDACEFVVASGRKP